MTYRWRPSFFGDSISLRAIRAMIPRRRYFPLVHDDVMGEADDAQLMSLRAFGHHVGLAFQPVDDELGLWGDPAVTGKAVGAELLRYKKSMPVVAAMNFETEAGSELVALYENRCITDQVSPAKALKCVERAGGRAWRTASNS
ncbi:polyprenyl synthetase family protein [Lentzea sp. NPDC004782]|uniref:polyprenyl synthetase family protein n=1 Tax=Lentzea sp. NPDC004782 TaxID=3154458 RepID=UPI0033B1F18F